MTDERRCRAVAETSEVGSWGQAASARKSTRSRTHRRHHHGRRWDCLCLALRRHYGLPLQILARHRDTGNAAKSDEGARASKTDLGENGGKKMARLRHICEDFWREIFTSRAQLDPPAVGSWRRSVQREGSRRLGLGARALAVASPLDGKALSPHLLQGTRGDFAKLSSGDDGQHGCCTCP